MDKETSFNPYEPGSKHYFNDQKIFDLYTKDFNLSLEDLRNKRILDAGGGSDPQFVNYLLKNNITDKAFSMDGSIFMKKTEKNLYAWDDNEELFADYVEKRKAEEGAKYVRGVGEEMPFRADSFDLIISRAVPFYDLDKFYDNALYSLAPGGKLIVGPFFEDDEEDMENKEIVEEILETYINVSYSWQESGDSKEQPGRMFLIVQKNK